MLVPLAHGALGIWDEVIPVLLVGGFSAILVVTGFLSRRSGSKLDHPAEVQTDQLPETLPPANQPELNADHYRLD